MSIAAAKKSFRFSIIHGLVLALTLSLGITVSPLGSAPAVASDPAGMSATSKSSGANVPSEVGRPLAGPCSKGLPSNPTVDCGYVSFGARLDVAGLPFRRAVSGRPGTWKDSYGRVWKDNYVGQCQGSITRVYDPSLDPATGANHAANKPANSGYYSIGVWWRDNKRFVPRTRLDAEYRVYNNRWKYEKRRVPERIFIPFLGYITIFRNKTVPVLNDPKTVTIRTIYNRINGSTRTDRITLRAGQSATARIYTTYPFWISRLVDYGGCNFPRAPKIYTNICAASIGPGFMTGPYGNAATTPWPVPTGVNSYDPQTELKRWNTRPANASRNPLWKENGRGQGTLYSNIGLAYTNPINSQLLSNAPFVHRLPQVAGLLQYVENCPDIYYKVSARDSSCVYLGSTFGRDYGRTFPARSKYCGTFTPGNYFKDAQGKTMKCQYAETFWNPEPSNRWDTSGTNDRRAGVAMTAISNPTGVPQYRKFLLGCDAPRFDRASSTNGWANWVCNDSTGRNGRNERYNFANCSGWVSPGRTDIADDYRCVAPDAGEPRVVDPETGFVSPNRAQVLASGKQVQVVWPSPTGISVFRGGALSQVSTPENLWQKWGVLPGSQPVNQSLPLSHKNQTIFGNYLEGKSPDNSVSVIGGRGKDGWDTPWLYLRSYKAANVNVTNRNAKVGDETVAPGSSYPLALTTTFNATIQRTISTGLGGSVEINVPISCDMPEAYLYVVSGRATD